MNSRKPRPLGAWVRERDKLPRNNFLVLLSQLPRSRKHLAVYILSSLIRFTDLYYKLSDRYCVYTIVIILRTCVAKTYSIKRRC